MVASSRSCLGSSDVRRVRVDGRSSLAWAGTPTGLVEGHTAGFRVAAAGSGSSACAVQASRCVSPLSQRHTVSTERQICHSALRSVGLKTNAKLRYSTPNCLLNVKLLNQFQTAYSTSEIGGLTSLRANFNIIYWCDFRD